MRSKAPPLLEAGRQTPRDPKMLMPPGSMFGHFVVKCRMARLLIISAPGDREVWEMMKLSGPLFDHVSVSIFNNKHRCPSWEEMCFVKDLCFGEEELVIQYHPPHSKYINIANVLHLWKPIGVDIPLPPDALV